MAAPLFSSNQSAGLYNQHDAQSAAPAGRPRFFPAQFYLVTGLAWMAMAVLAAWSWVSVFKIGAAVARLLGAI